MVKPYKVLYHIGEAISIKTSVEKGTLVLQEKSLNISGKIDIPYAEIRGVEIFRLHGLGRMLKIQLPGGRNLYLSVIRFLVFGLFAVINFRKTGALSAEINEQMRAAS